MFHAIEFRGVVFAEVDRPGYAILEWVLIQEGTRLRAGIRPYVTESGEGPIEVADLTLQDGSTARAVQFAAFRFLDESKRPE